MLIVGFARSRFSHKLPLGNQHCFCCSADSWDSGLSFVLCLDTVNIYSYIYVCVCGCANPFLLLISNCGLAAIPQTQIHYVPLSEDFVKGEGNGLGLALGLHAQAEAAGRGL